MEFYNFEVPVQIYTGHGFARTINNVAQATAFLINWPQRCNSGEYFIALGACQAAIHREAHADWAREAFCQFAYHANILATGITVAPPDFDDLLAPEETLPFV